MKKHRYPLLDSIRGIVLISMILYHGAWNLVYLYNVKWDWYHSQGAYIWQQSICWIFILLSGFCWSMSKMPLKNGLIVFGGGLLVTMVTVVVMPSNRVVFGVLTCIGSCILLTIFLDKIFRKVPPLIGMVISFLSFLFTKHINSGYLGFGKWRIVSLPESWYQDNLSAYLGFTPENFYSTDYFSLFPWIFLFWTGYFLYHFCEKNRIFEQQFLCIKIPIVDFMGKHSLIIYLLHQPILFGIGNLLF